MSEDSLDEINQIMNDIEKLQSKAPAEPEADPAPALEPAEAVSLNEFQASGGGEGGSMEETLGDLGEEETGSVGLLSAAPVDTEQKTEPVVTEEVQEEEYPSTPKVVPISNRSQEKSKMSQSSGGPGLLSMTLKGDMELELNYESGEQSVSLKFDEGTFVVQLVDGTEFRVPMKKSQSGARRTG
ncbi:MAG: hypothetical protein KA715_10175 [Xanthomonadaceae bacterium]|nr:hypothetical protein [Xanthomonadaceae bacterium]